MRFCRNFCFARCRLLQLPLTKDFFCIQMKLFTFSYGCFVLNFFIIFATILFFSRYLNERRSGVRIYVYSQYAYDDSARSGGKEYTPHPRRPRKQQDRLVPVYGLIKKDRERILLIRMLKPRQIFKSVGVVLFCSMNWNLSNSFST